MLFVFPLIFGLFVITGILNASTYTGTSIYAQHALVFVYRLSLAAPVASLCNATRQSALVLNAVARATLKPITKWTSQYSHTGPIVAPVPIMTSRNWTSCAISSATLTKPSSLILNTTLQHQPVRFRLDLDPLPTCSLQIIKDLLSRMTIDGLLLSASLLYITVACLWLCLRLTRSLNHVKNVTESHKVSFSSLYE